VSCADGMKNRTSRKNPMTRRAIDVDAERRQIEIPFAKGLSILNLSCDKFARRHLSKVAA
jgi:hypothetical protein